MTRETHTAVAGGYSQDRMIRVAAAPTWDLHYPAALWSDMTHEERETAVAAQGALLTNKHDNGRKINEKSP
jgi:hypothetical protein